MTQFTKAQGERVYDVVIVTLKGIKAFVFIPFADYIGSEFYPFHPNGETDDDIE